MAADRRAPAAKAGGCVTLRLTTTRLRNLGRAHGFTLVRDREEHTHRDVLFAFRTATSKRYVSLLVRPGATLGWAQQELRETRRILEGECA